MTGIVVYEAGPSPIGHSTPPDIKFTQRLDSDATEHATNLTDGKIEGHVEMT